MFATDAARRDDRWWSAKTTTSIAICLFLCLGIFSSPATAIPRRGNEQWSLILCKFSDTRGFEPRTREWFVEWFIGTGQDTILQYFHDASNGVYTIEGSTVHGWFDLPYTRAEVMRLAHSDEQLQNGSEKSFAFFDKAKELCVAHAEQQGAALFRQKITVVNAEHTAVYGKKHGVLLTPRLIFSSVLAHEMVHSFFIGHSYSDRPLKVFPYSSLGEYDDRYDLMSTSNALMHPSPYGLSGPGLNGPHLDYLGWLPMDRVLYFGRDGRQNYTLRLSSLSIPHNKTNGWLLVNIPYDRDDPNNVYTVELRTPYNLDQGVSQAGVVIHKIQRVSDSYYSMIVTHSREFYELTESTEWVQFLGVDTDGRYQSIKVSVVKMYSKKHAADVRITSTFDPINCQSTEAKKFIDENTFGVDKVCKPRNNVNNVVSDAEVTVQLARNAFYARQFTFGLNACQHGRVWRAADPYDYNCVDPARASHIREDNQNDQLRKSEHSKDGCRYPFVVRKAFHRDVVCVTINERARIQTENSQSYNNLRHFSFFNGADTVVM
ncbi:hypothetical protein L596_001759 [Steinernema carpocapsae]|uniref:Peptidase M11 gametolysin domain-containing protein n=1 Tax=Steinernema carpocapsae TaxID=34508 RepID=A0A4U8UN67_STECR|nr:hypothetical protein L596_001759 [Steinernema carpocapsae]